MSKHDQSFTETLLTWYEEHGRKDLPWQHPRSAYRVWISEIMLQQTQVKTVISYFLNFMSHFPDVKTLALASEDQVLALWSGLGYYSRARNLHQAAKIIHKELSGVFPSEIDALIALPGIGASTAAAIASLAFNQPTAILDGNVQRVLSRYFLIPGLPSVSAVKKVFWERANQCMSQERCADYSQAIMDMGATCCTPRKPDCLSCPLRFNCEALKHGVVDDYPNKKPKKILPTQKQQFLLLHNEENRIYLEKRPPIGLWGGLWCLPSINPDQCPASYIRAAYQLSSYDARELMRIKHSFSHYHLHINALSLKCSTENTQIAECSGRWFSKGELSGLGLAKPVSMIIKRFFLGQ